jgi:hypothetical protein
MTHERILILGAAGRDFHNFNVVYRDDPAVTGQRGRSRLAPGELSRSHGAGHARPDRRVARDFGGS